MEKYLHRDSGLKSDSEKEDYVCEFYYIYCIWGYTCNIWMTHTMYTLYIKYTCYVYINKYIFLSHTHKKDVW